MDWHLTPISTEAVGPLIRELAVPPILARILAVRGYEEPGAARDFILPLLRNLPSPGLLPDMEPAVRRLIEALDRKELVAVYGDYDADGLTSTALLTRFLESVGARVTTYIPHRLKEGYGLNPAAVGGLADQGVRLIVTVDCGVSDHEAIREAVRRGLDVIVTDHHQMPAQLPPALAVINPQRADSRFPQKSLAGVGVAFFLAGGLRQALREMGRLPSDIPVELAPLLPLVAIGTVADVAPLVDVNRILVAHGLERFQQSRFPGLRALLDAAELAPGRPIQAHDVAFRLAPRLNAAGRIDAPGPGLDLLLSKDAETARTKAQKLDTLNRERRRMQEETYRQAEAMIEDMDRMGHSIVLWREGWPRGVVGLAAAKLAERYSRPALLLAVENGLAVGSGRSVRGFHLYRALVRCADRLVRFGGHEQAAGLSVALDQMEFLARDFEAVAAEAMVDPSAGAALAVDVEAALGDLTPDLFHSLQRLAPFGEGNPEPSLLVRNLGVLAAATVGVDHHHLKLTLRRNGARITAMGFGLGDRLAELGPKVSAVFKPNAALYQGRTSPGWKIVDVKREED